MSGAVPPPRPSGRPAPRPALRRDGDGWTASVPAPSQVEASWPRATELVPENAGTPSAAGQSPDGVTEAPVAPTKPQAAGPRGPETKKNSGKKRDQKKQKQQKKPKHEKAEASKKKDKQKGKSKSKGKQAADAPSHVPGAAPALHSLSDRPLTVMLTPEVARRLRKQATRAGTSEGHLVHGLLEVWLEPRS